MLAPDCPRCDRFGRFHYDGCDCPCHEHDALRGVINGILVDVMLIAAVAALVIALDSRF